MQGCRAEWTMNASLPSAATILGADPGKYKTFAHL
jgi:hypothetical protein